MHCQLKGSEKYCETGRGICCSSCADHDGCDKACLNDPGRCGYAGETPEPYTLPVPTLWRGVSHAHRTETK